MSGPEKILVLGTGDAMRVDYIASIEVLPVSDEVLIRRRKPRVVITCKLSNGNPHYLVEEFDTFEAACAHRDDYVTYWRNALLESWS